jgi:hypothetical protein
LFQGNTDFREWVSSISSCFYWILFHILHCLHYFTQVLIFILSEFIQAFICVLFNSVNHFYSHSFELFKWDFFTSPSLVSVIVELLTYCLIFFIFLVFLH